MKLSTAGSLPYPLVRAYLLASLSTQNRISGAIRLHSRTIGMICGQISRKYMEAFLEQNFRRSRGGNQTSRYVVSASLKKKQPQPLSSNFWGQSAADSGNSCILYLVSLTLGERVSIHQGLRLGAPSQLDLSGHVFL